MSVTYVLTEEEEEKEKQEEEEKEKQEEEEEEKKTFRSCVQEIRFASNPEVTCQDLFSRLRSIYMHLDVMLLHPEMVPVLRGTDKEQSTTRIVSQTKGIRFSSKKKNAENVMIRLYRVIGFCTSARLILRIISN